jgi:hypothetical protein
MDLLASLVQSPLLLRILLLVPLQVAGVGKVPQED